MISEKGLCKVLKAAYRQGYEYVPRGKVLTLSGKTWAIRCEAADMPLKAAQQIVGDIGYMPAEPVAIQAGAPNQTLMQDTAAIRALLFDFGSPGNREPMQAIPVIFKERWQLYQTEEGDVFAFDIELLKMVDFKAADPITAMYYPEGTNLSMGVWINNDTAIYIAPGRFSMEDDRKICHIAAYDWERQQIKEDPVSNMSLFDEDADEPVMDAE